VPEIVNHELDALEFWMRGPGGARAAQHARPQVQRGERLFTEAPIRALCHLPNADSANIPTAAAVGQPDLPCLHRPPAP